MILNLFEILGLDLAACATHLARLLSARQQDKLIDDDVVRVDVRLGQLLDESFRLVQRQELSDAHAHECRHLLNSIQLLHCRRMCIDDKEWKLHFITVN